MTDSTVPTDHTPADSTGPDSTGPDSTGPVEAPEPVDGAELAMFPARAPEVFADPAATTALFEPVLAALADVVDVPDGRSTGPTPCDGFTVEELRGHVLGWLQFFAQALTDPDRTAPRIDPETWTPPSADGGRDLVERAAVDIRAAVADGVAGSVVTMSQARMTGDAVLAMALGEYLVHGWDLAVATGRSWPPADDPDETAAEAALAFLASVVAPDHRGPDSGFFDAEVEPPAGATAFQRLLCFGGRNPEWSTGD